MMGAVNEDAETRDVVPLVVEVILGSDFRRWTVLRVVGEPLPVCVKVVEDHALEAGISIDPVEEPVSLPAAPNLALNFMAEERTRFATDDLFGGSDEECALAAAEVDSFAGPYMFDDDAVLVTVEYSVFPNWVGGIQVREVEVSGDTLTLRTKGARMYAGARRRAEARLVRAQFR